MLDAPRADAATILRLKAECRGYSELIGGTDIYAAVLEHGVRV